MSLFEDPERRIAAALSGIEKQKPLFKIKQTDGEVHTVRAVTDEKTIKEVAAALAERPLYIADGHHRYESALVYRREQIACGGTLPEDSPANYVMMTLIDFSDPGLLILPPHRLLCGLPVSAIEQLGKKLISFFDVQTLALGQPNVWKRVDDFLYETDKIRLVLYGLAGSNLLLLTLRDFAIASKLMPYFHSETYKKMDVSVVDHIILEELLGLSPGEETRIAYDYDRREVVRMVEAGEFQMAFIIKPVKPEIIKDIADQGDRMPRKSTYFYPKLPSGLLVHSLV
jgi:uncharacterized protein (DUF1015 family)